MGESPVSIHDTSPWKVAMAGELSSSDLGSGVVLGLPQPGGAPALAEKQGGLVCFVFISLFYSFLDTGLRSEEP